VACHFPITQHLEPEGWRPLFCGMCQMEDLAELAEEWDDEWGR
jgi:hypothetical protein